MNRLLFISLIFVSVLISCRSSKKIQSAIINTKRDTTLVVTVPSDHAHDDSVNYIHQLYGQLQNQKINFTTFTAKIKVDYVGGDDRNYNVNAFVRMYKDSVIWISI
ncbi:MAG TPA: DUF4292 domain-containing protein, partial [Chitinophagaceae bacterium]|nr:DUF4292 domain-containing protein [Chitinophagaceae bacterium]